MKPNTMTSRPDEYLGRIRSSESLDEIALYIRAQGTALSRGLRQAHNDRPELALDAICQYASQAETIEHCDSIDQARRLLATWGF